MKQQSKPFMKKVPLISTHLLLLIGAILWFSPFLWMFLSSVKMDDEIYSRIGFSTLTLQHYRDFFMGGSSNNINFMLGLFNSFFVATIQTIFFVFSSAITGYALSRLRFRGRKFLWNFILFQMLFPSVLFLIPTFLLIKNMGLYNSYPGLILPGIMGAMGVFMYAQFFRELPQGLIDAARIDGANELKILFLIILPLALPITGFLAVFQFMGRWDEFLWNFIIVQDDDLRTLPVLLVSFIKGGNDDQAGLKMAATTILTIPILVLFFFVKNFFVKGITTGAIK